MATVLFCKKAGDAKRAGQTVDATPTQTPEKNMGKGQLEGPGPRFGESTNRSRRLRRPRERMFGLSPEGLRHIE